MQNYSIWDCRSYDEYIGRSQYAKRKGHMPGALHYEWQSAMQLEQGSAIRPLDTVRKELLALGICE